MTQIQLVPTNAYNLNGELLASLRGGSILNGEENTPPKIDVTINMYNANGTAVIQEYSAKTELSFYFSNELPQENIPIEEYVIRAYLKSIGYTTPVDHFTPINQTI